MLINKIVTIMFWGAMHYIGGSKLAEICFLTWDKKELVGVQKYPNFNNTQPFQNNSFYIQAGFGSANTKTTFGDDIKQYQPRTNYSSPKFFVSKLGGKKLNITTFAMNVYNSKKRNALKFVN